MSEVVKRQKVQVGGTLYGQVGFERWAGKDELSIISYEGLDRDVHQVLFPIEAVPQLLKILLHAWATKNREFADATFTFSRMTNE